MPIFSLIGDTLTKILTKPDNFDKFEQTNSTFYTWKETPKKSHFFKHLYKMAVNYF